MGSGSWTTLIHEFEAQETFKREFLDQHSKRKGKVYPRTRHEDPEGEQRYSSTLSLISGLDGVGGQRHAPAALPPGKNRYPLYRRQGGPQGRSGRVWKISPPTGFRSPDRSARSHRISQEIRSYSSVLDGKCLSRNKS